MTEMDSCATYSEKGGVGKSSITSGLAAVAAARGMRVGVLDGDPRATATDELGIKPDREMLTLNDLLYISDDPDVEPADPAEMVWDVLRPAGKMWPSNVRVIPAERALGNRESDSLPFDDRLLRAMDAVRKSGEIDIFFSDLPSRAGGRLVVSILRAMRKMLVPATLTTDGYEGIGHALHTRKVIARGGYAPDLVGIVRNQVEPPQKGRKPIEVHKLFDDLIQENYGEHLLDLQIYDYSVREVARAASAPITSAAGMPAKKLVGYYEALLDIILATQTEASHV